MSELAEVLWFDAAEHRGDPLHATLRHRQTWGRIIVDRQDYVVVIHDTDASSDDADAYSTIIPRVLIESITYLRPDLPDVTLKAGAATR